MIDDRYLVYCRPTYPRPTKNNPGLGRYKVVLNEKFGSQHYGILYGGG
jgi:hypothetical protein